MKFSPQVDFGLSQAHKKSPVPPFIIIDQRLLSIKVHSSVPLSVIIDQRSLSIKGHYQSKSVLLSVIIDQRSLSIKVCSSVPLSIIINQSPSLRPSLSIKVRPSVCHYQSKVIIHQSLSLRPSVHNYRSKSIQ